MKKYSFAALAVIFLSQTAFAQMKADLPSSKVDFDEFIKITLEVDNYRKERLVELNEFLEMLKEEDVLLLDTRSKDAYDKKHIKGALHLNFSDFTEEKLAKKIPSKESKILIYCNNNIEGDKINFEAKAEPLALNIPTFINLYGYGYKNIYELSSLVPVDSDSLPFEGSDVKEESVEK